MTNNNLKEHIAWLLKSKPHIPSPVQNYQVPSSQTLPISSNTTIIYAEVPTTSTSVVPANETKREQSSQVSFNRVLGGSQLSKTNSFENKDTRKIEAVATTASAAESEAGIDSKQPMARLRSAPSSAAKPRLLAQNTFPSHEGGNVTLSDLRGGRRSELPTPRVTKDLRSDYVAPTPPSWKEDQEWTDLDMLDLTENFESEGGYSRQKKVVEKQETYHIGATKRVQGQKRKSEQLEEDLDVLSDSDHASSRQRTRAGPSCKGTAIQNSVAGGNHAGEDDPPPPYSTTVAPVERVNMSSSDNLCAKKIPSATTEKQQHMRQSLGDEEEPSLTFMKSLPRSQDPVMKVLDSSRKQRGFVSPVSSPSSSSKPGTNMVLSLTSPSKSSKGRKRQIVADSEDEDDEDGANTQKRASPAKTVLCPSTACDTTYHSSIALQKKISGTSHTKQNSAITPSYKPSLSKTKICSTLLETPLAHSVRKQSNSDDVRSVQQVLDMNVTNLQAEQSKLDQTLFERKESAYEHLCNTGEESQGLKEQIQACKQQITQIKRLIEVKSTHTRLNQRKKELKVVIMEALEHGLSGGEHHSAVKENSRVTKDIRALEEEVFDLLPFLKSLGSAFRHLNMTVVQSDSMQTEQILENSVSNAYRAQKATVPQKSYSPVATPSQTVGKSHLLHSPDISSPTKSFSNPNPSFERGQEPGVKYSHNLRSNQFSHVRVTPEYASGPSFDNEDGTYSTVMGTPPARMRDDDEWYSHNDDDADMLEAAHDLEHVGEEGRGRGEKANNSTVHYYSQGSREILKESSGNRQSQRDVVPYAKEGLTPTEQQRQQHTTPKGTADLYRFPWSKDVKLLLRDSFHLKGFRNNQLEAINATLGGQDVFVLMPTGGGKSLCYQLPAIVQSGKTKGITVVISPLLSLMEDQVQHLRKIGIQAFLLTGETSREEKAEIFDMLEEEAIENYIQLLYLTPEMVSKSARMVDVLTRVSGRTRLARIVIDEAHCVSQWGHDFRPDYKAIGEKRKNFKDVPMMALTATATENVKVDVKHNLGMTGCATYTQSFNRPNLHYEVRRKGKNKEVLESIASLIKDTYPNQCGIVYCLSRATCERLAASLRQDYRIRAHHYHAGMDANERKDVQKKWQGGAHHVIVATIAFGMGIDKSNVRFVIHHSIPKSLEGYYQETGRAGRDGKRSGCYLFYGHQDTRILLSMINDSGGNEEQKDRQKQMLRSMVHYCENESDCRRSQVLGYFSEKFSQQNCNKTCDNCDSNSSFEVRDLTQYAISAIRLAREMQGSRITMAQLVTLFQGRKVKKFSQGHNLEEYGVGADLDQRDVERLFRYLLVEEALKEENVVFNKERGFAQQYIEVGYRHRPIESGKRRIRIQIRVDGDNRSKKEKADKRQASKSKGSNKRKSDSLASSEYPASTYVSSPIQQAAATKGRKLELRKTKRASSNVSLLPNGYQRDSFVVADDHASILSGRGSYSNHGFNHNEYNDDDNDDEEAFAPLPSPPPSRINRLAKNPKRQVGPPITTDQQMESLDSTHQMLVEDFMIHAKRISEGILMRKNLREQPFTDTILREMVIRFAKTERDLLQIPGVDRERVRLYGREFLDLVKKSHNLYLETMGIGQGGGDVHNDDDDDDDDGRKQQQRIRNGHRNGLVNGVTNGFNTDDDNNDDDDEGRVYDPNHEIVNLISDDDDKYGSLDDLDLDQSQPIQSTYFEPPQPPPPPPPTKRTNATTAAAAADIRARYTHYDAAGENGSGYKQQQRKQQPSQRGRKGDGLAKASASKKAGSTTASHGRGARGGRDGRMGIGMMPV